MSLDEARKGLQMLQKAGTEKINFAGGEPFLHPELLKGLCKTSQDPGLAVPIISDGSKITEAWMKQYGRYVDVLGMSVDSFIPETNEVIGRGHMHASRVLHVREWCAQQNIKFKLNSVVCCFNWQEDMREQVLQLDPARWEVFQVLILHGENAGGTDLRDARPLAINDEEFWSFVNQHKCDFPDVLIPEPNDVMQNSYLLLDEELRFLDCSGGGKVPSKSILDVGVGEALLQSGFDQNMFEHRGGIYDWKRDHDTVTDAAAKASKSVPRPPCDLSKFKPQM